MHINIEHTLPDQEAIVEMQAITAKLDTIAQEIRELSKQDRNDTALTDRLIALSQEERDLKRKVVLGLKKAVNKWPQSEEKTYFLLAIECLK